MPTMTKLAADVFASVDGGSNPRNIVPSECQTWGTEVEAFIDAPVIGVGDTLNLDSTTATLVGNAATITKYAAVITTESLTTAAGSSQAFVITLVGVLNADLAFVQAVGGTNTRRNVSYEAVCTADTVTVTAFNGEPTNALNGTLKFNLWVLHK